MSEEPGTDKRSAAKSDGLAAVAIILLAVLFIAFVISNII